jgi:CRISPR-associated protein Csm3
MRFLGTVTLWGKIEAVTGLHVGGSGAGYEIGGVDQTVIRDVHGYPYIPGSSLKGKMRSLLEWSTGNINAGDGTEGESKRLGDVHRCTRLACPVCRLFGSSAVEGRLAGPTRVLVRDANPDRATREFMDQLEREYGLPKVEVKTENSINRIKGSVDYGLRSQERVHPGAMFDFEILMSAFEVEGCEPDDAEMVKYLVEAMRLLEDSALGGGGSRGSGQIRFHVCKTPILRSVAMYRSGQIPPRPEELVRLAAFDAGLLTKGMRDELKGDAA